MRVSLLSSRPPTSPGASGPSSDDKVTPAEPGRRRGVTAMEYLVMLSFILVVIITVVQHIGSAAKGLLQNSADATAKANEPSLP